LFELAFAALVADLTTLRCRWVLVGGWAVGVRSEARFTADIDVAVAVDDDTVAESLLFALRARGYQIDMVLEHEARLRLATARTIIKRGDGEPMRVDFLFASSGIEDILVSGAEQINILPGIFVPVAKRGHLIALKLLSNSEHRAHDARDLQMLARHMTASDWVDAAEAVRLIEERGYQRGKDLKAQLALFRPGA